MTSDDYRTVFDITEAGYQNWFFPAIGLAFICATLVLMFLLRIRVIPELTSPINTRGFVQVAFFLSVFITVVAFAITFFDYRRGVSAMRDGSAGFITGPVTNFVPMPQNGRGEESFQVDGVSFAFSDYVANAGFHKTLSHGGPVRQGSQVRIWHLHGQILRLEIRDGPTPEIPVAP